MAEKSSIRTGTSSIEGLRLGTLDVSRYAGGRGTVIPHGFDVAPAAAISLGVTVVLVAFD